MDKPIPVNTQKSAAEVEPAQADYVRFDLSQRVEHILFLISFTILGVTGLVQKYSASPVSQAIMEAFGGIGKTRLVHHGAAFVMLWVSIYHILSVLYRVYVLRVRWSMLPVVEDFKHLYAGHLVLGRLAQTPRLITGATTTPRRPNTWRSSGARSSWR